VSFVDIIFIQITFYPDIGMNSFEANEHLQKKHSLQWFYSEIELKVDSLNKAVAMMVQVVPGPRVEGFGSGFFYEKDGWPFFISAKHVIDDAQKYIYQNSAVGLITRGRKGVIKISGMEFFQDKNCDIAVAPLWRRPAQSYSHVEFLKKSDIARQSEQSDLNFYAFTGFPASRNKTYTGQQIKAHQRIITLSATGNSQSDDKVSPFKFFNFDPKNMYSSSLDKILMNYPQGMSGGPIFEIVGPINNFTPKLTGIGLACIPETNQLKSMRFDVVDMWLEILLREFILHE
jgi:hypothetical protein